MASSDYPYIYAASSSNGIRCQGFKTNPSLRLEVLGSQTAMQHFICVVLVVDLQIGSLVSHVAQLLLAFSEARH